MLCFFECNIAKITLLNVSHFYKNGSVSAETTLSWLLNSSAPDWCLGWQCIFLSLQNTIINGYICNDSAWVQERYTYWSVQTADNSFGCPNCYLYVSPLQHKQGETSVAACRETLCVRVLHITSIALTTYLWLMMHILHSIKEHKNILSFWTRRLCQMLSKGEAWSYMLWPSYSINKTHF